jgi:class 3 adenylate cyclase
MRCAKCARDNPDDAKFCVGCGNPIGGRCAKCGAENPADASFCKQCGQRLGGIAAPSAATARPERISLSGERADSAALDGERKTVTALFADIKGSMDLIEDLDPEEARAIVDPALKLMMEAVHHYGGYVAQSTGDGIFALFGAPVAHEDHPQRALYAALRMHEELKRYSDRIRAEGRLPIQARVGVNTGEVVVRSIATGEGRSEYVPVGHSTGIAARMQALAPVGSIAATEPIRKLCEGYFLFKSLGPTKVKGVSEPVNVYEVTGLGPLRTRLQRSASRGYTKFVGRQREMDAMEQAAEIAKSGHGQIVAAAAEPGVGKSRLFFEFKARNQSGWLVLEAFSVSYGKASAYLPVIDLLHGYFDIKPEDDSRKRREKVNGRLVTLDPTLEDTRPYLFGLLGLVEDEDPLARMDPQIRRQRIQNAVKRVLLRESLDQPLMLIFEDLHQIDDESQALLDALVESLASARILLLVNYRPEYRHHWSNKSYYTQARLDPLGPESAQEMLAARLGQGTDLVPLKRLIIDKTEGNPLFIEEIVEALFEEGGLVRNGEIKVARSLSGIQIPATVQAVLASRIDRLPGDDKDLLQTLAVIGNEFPLRLVGKVTGKSDAELNPMLAELQSAEFIYEQPATGDVEYAFKHALTQEVAYGSVLQERRKVIHERVGQSIETLYADSLDDYVSNLAHHYRRSGNTAKSVAYLRRAADQAHQRSAFSEAAAYFEAALERLKDLPGGAERDRQEIAIHTGLGDVELVTKGYATGDYERHQSRRRALAERLEDGVQLFFHWWGSQCFQRFGLSCTGHRRLLRTLSNSPTSRGIAGCS